MQLIEVTQTKFALGGNITLGLVAELSPRDTEKLFNSLWKQIYRFEKQFSRFIPKSELSIFNQSAGKKTPISPEFKNLLIQAKNIGEKTGGLYNPFILPALQRAGYLKSVVKEHKHYPENDYSERQVAGVSDLVIDSDWASIPDSTALDMGGCGKGYLADQLVKTLGKYPVAGYWLSLDGDIAIMGKDKDGAKIIISIQDADDLSAVKEWVVECPTHKSAVATSGTFSRKGQDTKKSWHHIIDPMTLKPAVTDIRLATVCSSTTLDADVLASCAVILGSKKAPAFLKKHGVTSALLQCVDKNGQSFEVQFGHAIKKSTGLSDRKDS